MNLDTPSIMFYTSDIVQFHNDLKENSIVVGEIIKMDMGRICNFADEEENYFAVMEKK
jgi:lactoylglutathione lyase